jgi:hypothetical protein
MGFLTPFGTLAGGYLPPPANSLGAYFTPTILGSSPGLWRHVTARFTRFLNTIQLTPSQVEDGNTKHSGVRACLNRRYWGTSSETANSMLIGSWGKATQNGGWYRKAPDVDILFLLPLDVYYRFQGRAGNKQSQLLQEVKEVLRWTYWQTEMRGDGQVVMVPFGTTAVEVALGFRLADGTIMVCDTNNGGSYKTSTAEAEHLNLEFWDSLSNGNARALARMLKQWRTEQNVPLKSFQLERIAVEFLAQYDDRAKDVFYYDWMVRDCFGYLLRCANTYLIMPGSNETVWLGDDWLARARAAHTRAVAACAYERENYDGLAGAEWQAIFGTAVPDRVS